MADVDTSADNANVEGEGNSQPDPIKNLKSEMDRKLGNLEQSNQQLLAAIESLKTHKVEAPPVKKKVSDLIFEDADEAAEVIIDRAETRIMKKMSAQQALSTTVSQLYSEYPELADTNSELTKKTVQFLNQYPESERQDPRTVKLAARDAAADLGVVTKSRRKIADDDFSFGNNRGGGNVNNRAKETAEDQAMFEVAASLGLDMNDPKKKERLVSRKRESGEWSKYKGNK